MNKNLKSRLAVYSARAAVAFTTAVAVVSVHAADAIDTSAATGGISAAQTALLVVIGAMTTFSIVIWGAKKIPKFFGNGR